MNDTIYRQAALDCEYQVKIINDIEYVMLSEVQMKMRKLPSEQPKTQLSAEDTTFDCISRQVALDALDIPDYENGEAYSQYVNDKRAIEALPSAQPEDYTEFKQEFLRMASYIDVLLKCSDEQKETLLRFISRLAEFMPWTDRD